MSGSGGTDFSGFGGGGGPVNCEGLSLRRDLESPNPSVTPTISTGDVLRLRLETSPVEVVIADAATGIAGSIVPTALLLECLRSGFVYVAEVTSVAGGSIRLHISSVK
jgi:hypothetical protein